MRGRTGLIAGLVAGLVLGGGVWVAQAAVPDANGNINACYIKPGGTLRVTDTGTCKKGETLLAWNQQGVPGVSGFEAVTERKEQTFSSGPLAGFTEGVVCPEGKVTVGGGGQATLILPGGDVESAAIVGSYPIQERFWTIEFARNGGDPIPQGTEAHTFVTAHCITAS